LALSRDDQNMPPRMRIGHHISEGISGGTGGESTGETSEAAQGDNW